MLVCERPDLLAENYDRAHQFVFLEHRNTHEGPNPTDLNGSHAAVITLGESATLASIVEVNRLPGAGYLTQAGFRSPDAWLTVKIRKLRRNSKG